LYIRLCRAVATVAYTAHTCLSYVGYIKVTYYVMKEKFWIYFLLVQSKASFYVYTC